MSYTNIDIQKIKKNNNDFSFLSTLFDLVVNADFIGRTQYDIKTNSPNNRYTNIWNTLSAIGEEIGDKFQININNFIDNINNIDLCNIKALQSIVSFFGIKYNIFKSFENFPLEIQELIDILSISREYLKSNKVSKDLQNFISVNCLFDDLINIDSDSISENQLYIDQYIDDNKLDNHISTIFLNHLSDQIHATYNDSKQTEIYKFLSNDILLSSNFQIKSDYCKDNLQYNYDLIKYNISKKFNLDNAVDLIKFNISSIDNFNKYEQIIINNEIRSREKPFNVLENQTRNKYYKELKFKEYFQFIENNFSQNNLSSNLEKYNINYDYLVYNQNIELSDNHILNIDDNDGLVINDELIKNVAHNLTTIVNEIRSIRQQIKQLSQKICIKGTNLLLSHVINEYLRSNILATVQKKCPDQTFIQENNKNEIITYIDPTNYFNIKTQNDEDSKDLNPRFWELNSSVISAINFNENTNIFTKQQTVNFENTAFDDNIISTFYKNILENNIDDFKYQYPVSANAQITYNSKLSNFLAIIFDLGADETTADNNCNPVISDKSLNLKKYKEELFYNYIGLSTGYMPYYYHTNTIHPSYQIHPYLKNFVEDLKQLYPIQNLQESDIVDVKNKFYKNINEYIDNDGYLINIWKNPLNTNTDYITNYEKSININNNGTLDPVVDYDGLFYPYAILQVCDYFNELTSSISNNSISCDISKQNINSKLIPNYYYGLNLSQNEITKITNQLSIFKEALVAEATRTNQHPIYKYALDIYGNAYILIKNCNLNDDLNTQKNADGVLWVRYHNHPIAFPAFVFQKVDENLVYSNALAQFSKISNKTNEYIISEDSEKISINEIDNNLSTVNVQDFCFSNNKQNLIINIKNGNNIIPCICKVNKMFNDIQKYFEYYLGVLYDANSGQVDKLIDSQSISNYRFYDFFQQSDKQGVIYYNEINSDIKINIYYYSELLNFYKRRTLTANIKLDINKKNNTDIAIDVDIDNNINIAYIAQDNIQESINLSNIFEHEKNYNDISNYIRYDQKNYLITKKYYFGNSDTGIETEIENSNSRYRSLNIYNTYTDNGFIGLFENENNLSGTSLANELSNGILKFQLIGESIDTPIDYKLMLPVKMFENFNFDNNLSLASQLDVHYLEKSLHNYDNSINFENHIYDPYLIQKNINDNDVEIRVLNDYYTVIKKYYDYRTYNKYMTLPYIYYVKDKDIPNKYVNPRKNHITNKASDNNFILNLFSGINPLSISWYKNSNNEIQLDFNSYYYNEFNFDNYFNEKRLFLSLEKPGLAGYINIYHTEYDESDETPKIDLICYIKNISDEYPKFILSAYTFDEQKIDDNKYLMTEDNLSTIVSEDNKYLNLM